MRYQCAMAPRRWPSICYVRQTTVINTLTMRYKFTIPLPSICNAPLPPHDMNVLSAPPCYQHSVYMLRYAIHTPVCDAIGYAPVARYQYAMATPLLACHQCATHRLAIRYPYAPRRMLSTC